MSVPADEAARHALLQAALDADQAELTIRREVLRATYRRLVQTALAPDVATVRRTWAGLGALAEELAAVDPAAAEIVEACAQFLVGVQVNDGGVDRLGELGHTLSEVLPPQ